MAFLWRGAEFFELISKAQGKRADDQRGLLDKSDLVLPDFLRLADSDNDHDERDGYGYGYDQGRPRRHGKHHLHQPLLCSTPAADRVRGTRENGSALSASHQSQSLDSGVTDSGCGGGRGAGRRALMPPSGPRQRLLQRAPGPFPSAFSPVGPSSSSSASEDWPGSGQRALEDEESMADLTLVGEGDISSPNSSLLPPHAAMADEPRRRHGNGPSTSTSAGQAGQEWAGSGISPV